MSSDEYSPPGKMINDPIHGQLEIDSRYMCIIDTPEFQRLRKIKQLGCSHYVYPGAKHTRFEHCLGVCHLAELMVKTLQLKQPELHIIEEDIICVGIAGLCHDLGHGPFSHSWEKFLKKSSNEDLRKWSHEEMSVKIFEKIWNKLCTEQNTKFQRRFSPSWNKQEMCKFIKELIDPPDNVKETGSRGGDKGFLYDIVSNKSNGIDVDKWDYFLRDCHYLGFNESFNYERVLKFARVIKVNNVTHIAFRDKERLNLYRMFYSRWDLHCRAYQHRVTKCIEVMLCDALTKYNEYLQENEMTTLYNVAEDVEQFLRLDDDLIQRILNKKRNNDHPKLNEAVDIIERIENRDFYTEIGRHVLKSNEKNIVEVKKLIYQLDSKNIIIAETLFEFWGKKLPDFSKIKFFDKKYVVVNTGFEADMINAIMPRKLNQTVVHCIAKKISSEENARMADKFQNFCDDVEELQNIRDND